MDSRESGCDRRYTFRSMRPGEFTVKDAALACGVSESTIRRRLPAFPNARRETDEGGAWIIPADDLLGEGFTLVAVDDPAEPRHDAGAVVELMREVGLLTAEVDELERANSRLEEHNRELLRRADAADAVVAEQLQTIRELGAALDDARRSLAEAEAEAARLDEPASDPPGSADSPASRSERALRLEAARRALDEIGRHD